MKIALKLMPLLCCLVATVPISAGGATYCEIASANVSFGTYDALAPARRDTIGSITVTCTGSVGDKVSYSISLDTLGQNGGYRVMTNGEGKLYYVVYTDSWHTQVWGDGGGGSSVVSDSFMMTTSRITHTYPIFGRIPAGQKGGSSGTYSANLAVTLAY
jgi:spore coat protein U-like protein